MYKYMKEKLNPKLLIGIVTIIIIILIAGIYIYYTPTEGELDGEMNESEFSQFLAEVEESESNIDSYTMMIDAMAVGDRQVDLNVTGDVNTENKEANINYDMSGMNQEPLTQQSVIGMYLEDDIIYRNDSIGSDWDKEYINESDEFNNINEIWSISNHGASSDMYKYGDVYVLIEPEYIEVQTNLDNIEMNYISDDLRDIHMMGASSFGDTIITEKFDRDTKKLQNYTLESVVSVQNEDVRVIIEGGYEYNTVDSSIIPDDVRKND